MLARMDTLSAGADQFTISRAVRSDVAAVVALLTDDILGRDREGADLSVYDAAFDEVDADPNQFLAVVREAGGAVVGTFQLTLIPSLGRGAAKRLQIEAVRVAATHRGSGLGAAMMAWAHEYGRSRGASLAQLTTDKQRVDAHRFYERLGYTGSHLGFKRAL